MANSKKKHQRLVCIKKKYIFAAQSTFKIMEEKEVRQTLDDIREMMSKSSRFQAISGWSIIVIGLYAAVASLMAAAVIGVGDWLPCCENLQRFAVLNTPSKIRIAALIAVGLFALSLLTVPRFLYSISRWWLVKHGLSDARTLRINLFHYAFVLRSCAR